MIDLQYRMYGLVPYNLSPIQQGIQYGHAVVEYSLRNFKDPNYQAWANLDKTFIILNGGTTNNRKDSLGTLNLVPEKLGEFNIKYEVFHEPDLGDQLTAVVFLVDERVWDKEKYPDPPEKSEYTISNEGVYYRNYDKAISNMGGEKIWELRQYLSQFKLA